MEIAAVASRPAVPPGAAAYGPDLRASPLRALIIIVFLLGSIVNTAAYWSAAPVVVFAITLAATLGLVRLLGRDVAEERAAVVIMFIVSWFWAGVSASYLAIVGYENPDSGYFHEAVLDKDVNPIAEAEYLQSRVKDISVGQFAYDWFSVYVMQNAGAIVTWRLAYDFFSFLNLGYGKYIGVTMNTAFVALSVAMGLRMVKGIFGADQIRIRRYVLLCATCGMFWLFASLHVRDSMALFCVTFLAMFWVYYLQEPNIKTLIALALATVIGFMLFGLVRTEFLFVPLAMIMAGIGAKTIGVRGEGRPRRWWFAGLGACLVLALSSVMVLYPPLEDAIVTMLEERGKFYAAISFDEGAGSLGNQLIVSQTGLIKLLMATPYLLLAPVPVWVGFFSDLAYHLYKTFNAIFMYCVLPLVAVALWRMAQNPNLRRPALLFAAFCFVGFAAAVAYTSLEGRHMGSFYIFLILLALVPNLGTHADRRMYKFGFAILMAFIVPMHVTWLAYKALV